MWMQVYVNHFGVSIKNINLFGAKIPFKYKRSFRGKAVIFIKKYATAKEAEVLFLADTWNPNKENVDGNRNPNLTDSPSLMLRLSGLSSAIQNSHGPEM